MRLAPAAVVAVLVAAAGCYETPRPACAFLCGSDNACPVDYTCASDGWCKREDVADDFSCGPAVLDAAAIDAAVDAPEIDAPEIDAPTDAETDAAIDAETDAAVDAPDDAAPAMLSILSSDPLDFGSTTQTQPVVRSVIVRNGGQLATTALTAGATGTNFSLVAGASDTCTGQVLAPSTMCSFDVRFAPATTGPFTGIASAMAAEGGSASINLTGTSTPMLVGVPSPVDFGSITAGTMVDRTLILNNDGSVVSGTITTTAPTGAFSIVTDGCHGMTVDAGNACSVLLQFAPPLPGPYSATITFDASPGGPRTITLNGAGT